MRVEAKHLGTLKAGAPQVWQDESGEGFDAFVDWYLDHERGYTLDSVPRLLLQIAAGVSRDADIITASGEVWSIVATGPVPSTVLGGCVANFCADHDARLLILRDTRIVTWEGASRLFRWIAMSHFPSNRKSVHRGLISESHDELKWYANNEALPWEKGAADALVAEMLGGRDD